MSTPNKTRNLLDIQDTNIIFEENCVIDETHNGKSRKYVGVELTYFPTYCENCGIKN